MMQTIAKMSTKWNEERKKMKMKKVRNEIKQYVRTQTRASEAGKKWPHTGKFADTSIIITVLSVY